ncbi:unnamed protein product [Adineta steineri]|nr:unnamed protein product [Adineta steineri]
MVYRNQYDGGTIVRRCCSYDCGTEDGLRDYEGRTPAYFCSQDLCNDALSDMKLSGTSIGQSTTSSSLTTNEREQTSSLSCYDCTGHNPQCGTDPLTLVHGCKACMVYLNAFDGNTVVRRCCTSGCGSSGTVSDYEGRTAYFCTSNQCNGIGTETVLTGGIISTSTTTHPTSTTSTQTSSFQCYDCSGSDCGREGSTLSTNCPTCMVYRNPDDQTKIERHCCWWGCGPSYSVSTYNGIQTYFCSANKCNGYGSENILDPPITTTQSITSTSTSTTTTYSSSTCTLNCRNGSTPETEDGCFCYCLGNTNGRECENIDCNQSDTESETCSWENRPLCEQSETYAYACVHLCGKC